MAIFRRTVFYLLLVAGSLLILATLLSLIHDLRFWYFKVLDFPRLQVLIALLVCLILFAVVNKRWTIPSVLFLLGLLTSMVLQARFILPYTPLADLAVKDADPHSVTEGGSFSLLVVNVLMYNDQAEAFLEMVYASEPDIVLAMETHEWWLKQLTPLHNQYPHRVLYPLDNTYGIALYSKLPLNNTEIMFLGNKRVPSIHSQVSLPNGSSFMLHAMHPVPPKPSKYPDNIGEKEVALLKVGEMISERKIPTVVAGDFNDVAWSKTSRLFGIKSGLGDVRTGRGLYNSFDATSNFLRWPLDHIYVSREFSVLELKRLQSNGSDHFPILIKLVMQQ